MSKQTSLAEQLRINEQNLNRRKQFLNLSQEEIELLRHYAPWAEQIAPQMMREFYEFQFNFPETRAFFEQYARKKGITLDQLRQFLERAQAGYFLDIFREAAQGGRFGVDYFEKRLRIGFVHNEIDLPMKWYLGSYKLYSDLLARYIQQSEQIPPEEGQRLFRAVVSIFMYDIQAVVDSFLVSIIKDFGLNPDEVEIRSSSQDLTEYLSDVRRVFSEAIHLALGTGDTLFDAASSLTEGAHQTRLTAGQIASAVEQVAQLTTHQVAQLHQAAEATRQMTEGIQTVAHGADQQTEAVQRATRAIEQVGSRIHATAEKMRAMGEHSQRIGEMIEVVNHIAFQTHLLALNAAIEAARAGESGRGFAVVAKEVQQLADRSAQSAKEVGQLVNQIRAVVSDTIKAMEQSIQVFEQELVSAVEEVERIVQQYREVTGQMSQNAQQVSRAMDESVSLSEQTSAAAEQVSASTEQLASGAEELARWSSELHQIAERLQQALRVFRSSATTAARAA
jgi:methyl-accepting chemotaxis protein